MACNSDHGGTMNVAALQIAGVDVAASLAAKATWLAVVPQALDLTTALAAFVNTDMVFNYVASSRYLIEMWGWCTSAANTSGYRFGIDTSAAVDVVTFHFLHQLANAGTLTGGSSIADAAATGLSSGVPTNGALVPVYGMGMLGTGVGQAGTARIVFGGEVAASVTLKAGTVMRVHKVV